MQNNMKNIAIILLTVIALNSYAQDTTIVNFCVNDNKITTSYSFGIKEIDTIMIFSEIQLLPEYATLELIICEAYGIESSQVISFIYQNKSQTAWLQKERIGLIIVGTEMYNWKLIDEENFSPSQLYAINDFGEKLKTLINTK